MIWWLDTNCSTSSSSGGSSALNWTVISHRCVTSFIYDNFFSSDDAISSPFPHFGIRRRRARPALLLLHLSHFLSFSIYTFLFDFLKKLFSIPTYLSIYLFFSFFSLLLRFHFHFVYPKKKHNIFFRGQRENVFLIYVYTRT